MRIARRVAAMICMATAVALPASVAIAADPLPASRPALPALEQLNRECIALHQSLQGSILRVQMPQPRGNAISQQQDDPRWGKYQLTPNVKSVLRQRGGGYTNPNNYATTQPVGNTIVPNGQSGGYGGGNAGQQPAQIQPNGPPAQQPQNQQPQTQPPSVQPPAPPPDVQQQRQAQQVQQQQSANEGGATQNSSNSAQGGQGFNNDGNGRAQGITIVVPPPQQVGNTWNVDNGQQQAIDNRAVGNNKLNVTFVPNNLGLLLDDKGHVLVPNYIEREAADQAVKLAVGDGEVIEARLVGSDQQTQLTVLQLSPPGRSAVVVRDEDRSKVAKGGGDAAKPAGPEVKKETSGAIANLGKPLKLSGNQLSEGSVVVVLSPMDAAPRLSVWNGAARDAGGVIVTIDGEIAGIARGGQFLSGAACQLIADQIIRHGAVKRATLGVIITQVDAADGGRALPQELADKPTLRVDQVIKGSVAEQGGLRQGDLILSVASEPVHNIPALSAAIAARQGETRLKVLREGKVVTVTVNLIQR